MNTIVTKNIQKVVNELKAGQIAGLPTETVYGLAANALDPDAVLKIYETKGRPIINPLIVHVSGSDELKKYVNNIPKNAKLLMEKFSPGPITFVLKKKKIIPDIVSAGFDTVAMRIPAHLLMRKVIRECGFPLCAPSANMFGKVSPITAQDVKKDLSGKLRYILDGGKCKVGIESTIVAFERGIPVVLRHGGITEEQIVKITGKIKKKSKRIYSSPGMLKYHYAPSTPLYIMLDEIDEKLFDKRTGILFRGDEINLREIALKLFPALRKLDEKKYEYILTGTVKEEGIGRAINERLLKASKGIAKIQNGKIILENK